MSVFIKNGNFIKIEINKNEIMERYFYRCYLIANQKPKNKEEYDKYVLLSNYLSNIKFLKCSYNEKIQSQCNEMLNNIGNI